MAGEIAVFETKRLNKIVEKAKIKFNFLTVLLALDQASKHQVSMSDVIKIKLRNAGWNRIAKPVSASAAANSNTATSLTELTVTAPRLREKTGIDTSWAYAAIPENQTDATEWMKFIVANIATEMELLLAKIANTHEQWIAQILQTGTVSAAMNPSGTFSLNLGPTASHFHDYSADANYKWDVSTNSKVAFISEKETLITKAGFKANVMIFGSKAGREFLKDEEVRKLLDIRNVDAGAIKLNGQEVGGYTYIGRYDGKDAYIYEAEYTDIDGTTQKPFIAPGNFIMTSTMVPWSLYFASIKDTEALNGQVTAKYFSKSWEERDPSSRVMLVESDSTPACENVDGIVCYKMVADA